ncbi:low temperature requirement protein A [Jatrophihabitans telluris]|uniref:Low temperature requirement protein A n=1 Tax=Jatrophihabitans telluris TaxID=2038343 RepID=A0ABY4QX78_9ACTN|nr:low temperature requirement protein A [Jatrophihabitans telluris]UQX87732.1 low temperature requirement protein A [Jatrophihabitans telluris]
MNVSVGSRPGSNTKDPRAEMPSYLRSRGGEHSVTNIELFFDLVYVFAITQMSHQLLHTHGVEGVCQTAIMLAMIWLLWVYTTWVTNWLDPDRDPLRLLLVGLMLASLVLSASLPDAFGHRGLVVGLTYASMQIVRSAVAVALLAAAPEDRGLRLNFERILSWCALSGALAVAGGAAHGHGRELLWLLVIVVDLTGGAVGFWTPGLGRSRVDEWTIDGAHFAERCQAFVLIALGESLVVVGAALSGLSSPDGPEIAAFVVAFLGAAALWWVYFDRSGPAGAWVIARSADPGRLGRSAYHFLHPIMIGGIIVSAAADEQVLAAPTAPAHTATAWLVLGGTALFLAGHAAFTTVVWRSVPWTRLIAIVCLALLAIIATRVSGLALASCALVVLIAVCAGDRLLLRDPYGTAPETPGTGRGDHGEHGEHARLAR